MASGLSEGPHVPDYRDYAVPTNIVSSWPLIREMLGDGRVLDVGCGDGGYLALLSPQSVGVDLSEENLAKAASRGLNVVPADLAQGLPFADSSFDSVMCSHVLEHMECPLELLRELARVCTPGGRIAVGVPTEGGFWRRVRGVDVFKDHPEHLYAFSADGMRRLGTVVGFESMDVIFDAPLVKRLGWSSGSGWFNRLPEYMKRHLSDSLWLTGMRSR